MLGLDIGCGDKKGAHMAKRQDIQWIGLDAADFSHLYPPGEFVRHNLIHPLPFPDRFFDIIVTHHALEHLPHTHPRALLDPSWTGPGDLLVFVLNEIWRVLKPGSEAHIVVPWKEHTNAWRSPTHYRFFDENFWNVFSYKAVGAEHFAWKLWSKWKIIQNKVVDQCHVYAILKALQWVSPEEYRQYLGAEMPLLDYKYAGIEIEGITY